jgi:hypothetical protein
MGPALGESLAADHARGADQRDGIKLADEARLAHAALPGNHPHAAPAFAGRLQRGFEHGQLRLAADKLRGLQEALPGGRGLGRQLLSQRSAEIADDLERVAIARGGIAGQQLAEDRA